MLTADFDYDLPQELIAQTPLPKREQSRMMILDRRTGKINHSRFEEFADYLNKGDVLVLNNTKVIPARAWGKKEGKEIEFLFLKESQEGLWEVLCRPAKKASLGDVISFSPQTVFARKEGAVAAPTAGLHFTPQILERIKTKRVQVAEISLDVGLATFQPVRAKRIEDFHMLEETYSVSQAVSQTINEAKKESRPIIAVGTTSVRTLESAFKNGKIHPGRNSANLFIYPGYEFKAVDRLLTNFHLPQSTLLMLVAAFAGLDFIKKAYQEAVRQKYRFYSYGDCMFIL